MVYQLLDSVIIKAQEIGFDISEFHLGEGLYEIFKDEYENMVNQKMDITKINTYRGIPVKLNGLFGMFGFYCKKNENTEK